MPVLVELVWQRDHGKQLTTLQQMDLDERVSTLASTISSNASVPLSQTEGPDTFFTYTFESIELARRFLDEVYQTVNRTETFNPEGFRIPFWSLGQFLR